MQVSVRYFAVFRERLGRDVEALELAAPADVAAAIALLEERHPAIARLRGRYRVALNQAMVDASTPLSEGDELALIPPVAGGSGESGSRGCGRRACMVPGEPSLARVVDAVMSPAMGGLVTFSGVVRRESRGRSVVRLEYEAYDEMVNRVLSGLCDELEGEFAGCRVAVEHRAGSLEVGEVAVVIAAAAPHRKEAFAACEAAIDRLKERAPIWKKEIGEGGEEWVGLGP